MQQIAVRAVQLDGVEAERARRRSAAWQNAAVTRASPLASSASGGGPSAVKGTAEGATVGQASSPGVSGSPPSHGRWQEALRPAWPSWMPKRVPGAATRRAA